MLGCVCGCIVARRVCEDVRVVVYMCEIRYVCRGGYMNVSYELWNRDCRRQVAFLSVMYNILREGPIVLHIDIAG
jgi:hypothetical protein